MSPAEQSLNERSEHQLRPPGQSDLVGRLGRVPRSRVWFAVLAAPLAWSVQVLLGVAVAALACAGMVWPLYLLDALALLVSLWALGVALQLRGLEGQPPGVVERVTHFAGRFGAWMAAVFVLAIVLTGIGNLLIPACRLS